MRSECLRERAGTRRLSPSPGLKMATFAKRTGQLAATLFSGEPAVLHSLDAAWRKAEL